jgi:hypothetical protein
MPEAFPEKFDGRPLARPKKFVLEFRSSLISACNTAVIEEKARPKVAH